MIVIIITHHILKDFITKTNNWIISVGLLIDRNFFNCMSFLVLKKIQNLIYNFTISFYFIALNAHIISIETGMTHQNLFMALCSPLPIKFASLRQKIIFAIISFLSYFWGFRQCCFYPWNFISKRTNLDHLL